MEADGIHLKYSVTMCRSKRGGGRPVQACIDHPPAGFDGGMVPEIVGGFENDPGRVQRICPVFGSSETIPGRLHMPNESAFMADISSCRFRSVVSLHGKRRAGA